MIELLACPGDFEPINKVIFSITEKNMTSSEDANDVMNAKRELLEQRMKIRQNERDAER